MAAILESSKAHELPPVHTLDPYRAREVWNKWLIQSADPEERRLFAPQNVRYGGIAYRLTAPSATLGPVICGG
jgi:hypothetical protein